METTAYYAAAAEKEDIAVDDAAVLAQLAIAAAISELAAAVTATGIMFADLAEAAELRQEGDI